MHRFQGIAVQLFHQAQKTMFVAQGLCCVVILLYFIGFAPRAPENLAVTPAFIMPPNVKVWTLVTATFFERRIIYVILDVLGLIGFSAVLQPFWSAREFAIFSGIVSVSSLMSGVCLSVFLYSLSPVSQSVLFLLTTYHGMIGLVCGYVVAVKQFHPDSVPFPPPTPPTLRVKHIPMVIVIIFPILSLCGVVSYASVWLAINGMTSSWVYLRFFQKNQNGTRGDMSESFSFASFFPEPLQPPLARLGGFIYHLLVTVKICPKIEMTYDVGAPSQINLTLPGTDRVDAQRRKQRALKALDERLGKTVSPPQTWPSLDETGSSQDEQELPSPPHIPPPPSSSSHQSHPLPPPPPEKVVVEKIPPSSSGGGGGGDAEGDGRHSITQLPATKTDSMT